MDEPGGLAQVPINAFMPVSNVLGELRELLTSLTPEQYTLVPAEIACSSIGAHVRHCLDHVSELLAGIEQGVVNYDHRDRDTPLEKDPGIAINAIDEINRQLRAVSNTELDRALVIDAMVTASEYRVKTRSSVGRELVFVLSHTVHHNAMIGAIARRVGANVPGCFGLAPATVAHLERTQCAPSPSSP